MLKRTAQNTILVAGGAGFVGSHLCETLLRQGHRVICLDSFLTGSMENVQALCNFREFRLIRQDVVEPLRLSEQVQQIYNLASPASPPQYQADPVHTMMTNVVGTQNLLALAEAHGARFLQASTSEVYGDPEIHPQPEDYRGNVSCTGSRACYDEGKRAAETLCFDYRRRDRADVRVARIFNTYGPHMRPDDGRIVSNLLVQALQGVPLTIYGTGAQTRSFCYVTDLVAGLMALMAVDEAPEGAINLGNPGEFTIAELADLVQRLVPSAAGVVHRPLPEDDPRRRRPDISRAKRLLGWEPRVPLSEGLPQTAAWFARHLGRTLPAPLRATRAIQSVRA
ncbi:SDR family oxidoreductase [Cereibacter azotoformans]|uniref:UDP-glucuronate decarboxylase n=2 Tax=Cereibacter TaxID=1653176 RepID=A0A2T5K7V3_9RHOB|nr:UDP-glucuronic acid decarboxylase family protein [Cereibacter azotoformans]AXQ94296.1 SDR family oxidoreductase [Cereibacter sphaeroides]MBO4167887.1 SDR family oxidoreductase [Cereibacter azotoformans]PTR18449.1 UDP-glucuronate decarboxylase [Cereibacter azotoformans]UIJ29838.1 SDR family oxidoreductase [Cereibacter azotoformans]ULB10531.1 SDR family oxidoreductase [Cereibacter azotoformans]